MIEYGGVKVIPLSCRRSKSFEAITHTFLGLFAALKVKPDLLHIHAIGPALLVPLARLMGFKVVFTTHGPDYERKKWNLFAKMVLKTGECAGVLFANEIIAISKTIGGDITKKYRRKTFVIPNE